MSFDDFGVIVASDAGSTATSYQEMFIILGSLHYLCVRGAADLGAGAEKSRRDLGGAGKNPVDVMIGNVLK